MSIALELMRKNKKEWLTKSGFAVALLLLIVISYISFNSINQFAVSSRLLAHTELVIKEIHQVLSDVKDAESAERGYLITGDRNFMKASQTFSARLPNAIVSLKTLTNDSPEQQKSMVVLKELIDKKILLINFVIEIEASKTPVRSEEIKRLVGDNGRQMMDQIRAQANCMIAFEEKLLQEREQLVEAKTISAKRWILFGNTLALLLLIFAFRLIWAEIEYRKASQRAAEKSAAQLELTNKELESFSYSVSHDLRSPLRAIDGYSRMFEEDFADRLDDEGRRLLGVIRSSSKKMGHLIDDLLAFSRLGRKPLESGIVDMNALVGEVWSEICSNAHVSLPLKREFLPAAWGDRALLRQAVMNLLANAVKYSSKNPSPVIVMTARQNERETVYSVRDNGVGFDMRFYNKLFGVFQRLHTENEFPGTGVGLAIAQRVIVRHGGRIWAESKPNECTVFSFSLPKGGAK